MYRLLCLLSLTLPAAAEVLTLQTVTAHALRHNADLEAARMTIAEAQGRLLQAGRHANPEVETEWKPNVRGREMSAGIGVMQKLPLTSRLRLEKAVSRAELAAAEAEVREAERKISTDVRTLAVKILALQARRVLEQKQITNGKEIATLVTKLAAAGEGSTLEAGQVELEAAQLELGLLQTDAEIAALTGELRPLLGMNSGRTLEISGELPEVKSTGRQEPRLEKRPDYQMATAKAEAASQAVKLAQAGKWEDLSIGLAAEVERMEDAPDGLEADTFIGLKFSLPLPLWNQNEGNIQSARAAAQRAEKEAGALALRIRNEAAAAQREMEISASILRQSDDLLPKTAALEERYRKSYGAGQSTLTEVLRIRDRRLSLQTARLNALRDFHLARVRSEAALGN